MQRAEAIRKTIRHYTLGGDLSIIAPTKELKTEEYLKSFLFKRRLYSLFQIYKEFKKTHIYIDTYAVNITSSKLVKFYIHYPLYIRWENHFSSKT